MIEITEREEKVMFHTLGYEYKPNWNDDRGGYRNWFGIYPSEDNGDYKAIKSLVEKGYMQKDGTTDWNEEVYSVTDIGKNYVVDLWLKKKKENKPSRSKRRYQAYLDWCDWNVDVTFKDFLDWLKITKEKELFCEDECEVIREYKKRWWI
jgi:hypothetical protein